MLSRRNVQRLSEVHRKPTEWIKERNSWNDLLNPEYMPMVEIPKGWTTPEGGGYWTEEMPQLDLVKIRNKRFKQELENFRMPEVYQAINTMQNTPFQNQ